MVISRRTLMKSTIAAGAALALPSALRAQPKQTVRMIMGDLQIFDPIFTTSDYTQHHAMAIYDMLFAVDANLVPQPQMVGHWSVSDDEKTYAFELRDGLSWHDGTPVTAGDCVASIRRWGEVKPSGRLLLERAAKIAATADKTFTITLKEPLGLLLDLLATPVSALYIMREEDAKLPATEQVTAKMGSGPFKFNQDLTRPGSRTVYDRNEQYVPRGEPASGYAGGKVVKAEQVIWENISDPQTALAALQAGEVDFWLEPVADIFPVIETDPGHVLDTLGKDGSNLFLVMNHLQPPFNDIQMRQALLHLINQKAFQSLLAPSPKYGGTITSVFGGRTAYTNDINTDWFKVGGDLEKAKQLIAESGYAGEKVLILDPTDWRDGELASQLLADVLQKAGVNAELAPMAWSELAVRRGKKETVEDGGWSIFISGASDFTFGDPISAAFLQMNGEKGWYGWPQSNEYEALRAKWADVETLDQRKELAREMQRIWWNQVGFVFLCRTLAPIARSISLLDMVSSPAPGVALWNMREA